MANPRLGHPAKVNRKQFKTYHNLIKIKQIKFKKEIKEMTQLEEFYLMHVALYLPTYSSVYRFIQINKKCLDTIESLKITPRITGNVSIQSFHKRFLPDTMDLMNYRANNLDDLEEVELLRNFYFTKEQYEQHKDQIVSYFEKIHTLKLITSSITQYSIENISRFKSLYKIHGLFTFIEMFVKKFVEHQSEYPVCYPKIIFIDSDLRNFVVNESIVSRIEKMMNLMKTFFFFFF